MYEQQLHEIKTKVQMEESNRRKELEDRVKTIQQSKDDLINENSTMNAKIVDFQQKMASKALEIETLKRNNDSLRTVSFFLYSPKLDIFMIIQNLGFCQVLTKCLIKLEKMDIDIHHKFYHYRDYFIIFSKKILTKYEIL